MKLEAVPSAAKVYQGSVPHAASASGTTRSPKAVSVSVSRKTEAANVPKTVNVPETPVQSKRADTASVQTSSEDGKIIKREMENPDGSGKTVISDAEYEKAIPEDAGVQQNSKQLQEAVDKLREKMAVNTEAVFGIHEGTNRVMIKIVDKNTKDVIKEYPPEKTLDMIQKVWEMAGIMVDEKL